MMIARIERAPQGDARIAAASGSPRVVRRLCVVVPVHWSARMGGAQYQAQRLVEYLVGRYDVDVHYLTVDHDPTYRPVGHRIVPVSSRRGIRRYGMFFDCRRLYRQLARIRPDAILQTVACGHTGIAAFYAKRNDCLMAWRVSSDRNVEPATPPWWRPHHRVERRFVEYGIRNADIVIAQTEWQRQALAQRFRRQDAVVIRNFHPTPPDPGPKPAKKRILWVGNAKPLKNPAAFIRLAARYADRADVEFIMIGGLMDDGPWTRGVLQSIELTPNITYLGACPQEQVNAELERAYLLVNTSDYEGFSNTFVQAWMRRVPVLSLNVDPDGLLSRQGLGCVSGDEGRLGADLDRLLDDPQRVGHIGRRCREYAVTHHSDANIDELARLLRLRPITENRAG